MGEGLVTIPEGVVANGHEFLIRECYKQLELGSVFLRFDFLKSPATINDASGNVNFSLY